MTRLFVSGLSIDMDDAELRQEFEKFGTVSQAHVATEGVGGRSRGWAFVDMPNKQEALEAMEGLNGLSYGGHTLVVKEVDDTEPGGRGGGRPTNFGGGQTGGGGNQGNRDRNRF